MPTSLTPQNQDGIEARGTDDDADFLLARKPAGLQFRSSLDSVSGTPLEFGDSRQFSQMIAGSIADENDDLHLRKQVGQDSLMDMHMISFVALLYKVYR